MPVARGRDSLVPPHLAGAERVLLALVLPCLAYCGDYYVHVFALVLTNVILAASLRPSLTCGQLNIGHSAFMCVGRLHFGAAWPRTLRCSVRA